MLAFLFFRHFFPCFLKFPLIFRTFVLFHILILFSYYYLVIILSLKKIKAISIFGIFLLCFLTHFGFSIFPNFVTSIFFPVNESIFEHLKMLVSSIYLWSLFEFYLLKKYKIIYSNFIFQTFIMSFIGCFFFLIIYLPLFIALSHNFIVDIICLFITIYFVNVIGFYILNSSNYHLNNIGIVCSFLLYCAFAYFTYFPIHNFLFYDFSTSKYGINFLPK